MAGRPGKTLPPGAAARCLDNALSQKPADWDGLLKLLQEAGYEIKPGQNPSFRCEGWGRPVRLDTLGENDSGVAFLMRGGLVGGNGDKKERTCPLREGRKKMK